MSVVRRFLLMLWLAVLAGPAAAVLQDESTESGLRAILRAEAIAYENGEGVERDSARAASTYCRAAKLGDAESQFNLGWMYANGRGVERSDAVAAFFFHAAAEQGLPQAVKMLSTVGGPPNFTPPCMVESDLRPALRPTPPPVVGKRPLPEAPIVSRAPPDILQMVKKLAPEYRVDPRLALAVIETESNFDVVALSPKNARGLMQLIPATAARFGVRNAFDPVENVRGGMSYLRWLLAHFEGDVMLVAAAYNAGEGAVNRYRGVPPYAETRAYVAKVITLAGMLNHPFDASAADPSPQLPLMQPLRAVVRR